MNSLYWQVVFVKRPLRRNVHLKSVCPLNFERGHASSAYKRPTSRLITPTLKEIWKIWSKTGPQRFTHRGHWKILFTDKKIFTVEEKINQQNDCTDAKAKYFCQIYEKKIVSSLKLSFFIRHGLIGCFVHRSDSFSLLENQHWKKFGTFDR